MPERAENNPLNEKDTKKLVNAPNIHKGFKAMLYLVLGTGISPDEALAIKLQDIDYANNCIRVYDSWTGRTRAVKLNLSITRAITDYQNGRRDSSERLFDVEKRQAITRLYEVSQQHLGRPISWTAVRRTWAVLGFKNGLGLKDMMESSGATAQQLAVWSLWDKSDCWKKDPPDFRGQPSPTVTFPLLRMHFPLVPKNMPSYCL